MSPPQKSRRVSRDVMAVRTARPPGTIDPLYTPPTRRSRNLLRFVIGTPLAKPMAGHARDGGRRMRSHDDDEADDDDDEAFLFCKAIRALGA